MPPTPLRLLSVTQGVYKPQTQAVAPATRLPLAASKGLAFAPVLPPSELAKGPQSARPSARMDLKEQMTAWSSLRTPQTAPVCKLSLGQGTDGPWL